MRMAYGEPQWFILFSVFVKLMTEIFESIVSL